MPNIVGFSVPLSDPRTIVRVDVLFQWTMDMFGEYVHPPEVRILNHDVMAEVTAPLCNGQTVWGWYRFQHPDMIFLSDRLNLNTSRFAQCTLVHEIVHYLQQHSVKYRRLRPFTLDHIPLLEDEADRIMGVYDRLVRG